MIAGKEMKKKSNVLAPPARKRAPPVRAGGAGRRDHLPGSPLFFQRNFGNSHMQSMMEGAVGSRSHDAGGASTIKQDFSHGESSSCCPGKKV